MARTRTLIIVALTVFGFSLIVYLMTLAPAVTFVDSGELAAVVATDGVSHPTGSPLYLLIGSLVAAIPIGTLIVRLNTLSAVCAATSVALTFAAFAIGAQLRKPVPKTSTLPRASKKQKSRPKGEKKPAAAPVKADVPVNTEILFAGSVAASLVWLANKALWNTATVTEVYSLNTLFVSALAFFLVLYARATYAGHALQSQRFLAAASLTTGLALSNYPPFGILAPAVLFLIYKMEGFSFLTRWRRNGVMLSMIALGLLPYLLLPLRASADPLLNWGNPSNWKNFRAHVSAEQYQVFLGSPNLEVLDRMMPLWWNQWPPILWLLMVPGFFAMWRKQRSLFAFTVIFGLSNIFYTLSYDITDVESAPSDFETYYLPLFWISSLWIGAGIVFIIHQLYKRLSKASLVLALLPCLALAANWKAGNRSDYTYADDFARSILSSVAANALILCPDWTFVSPAMYLQHAENVRPDVVVFDGELLRRSWYFSYVRKRAPWLYETRRPSIEAFLHELAKFENNEPYDGNIITEKYVTMLNDFLSAGIAENHPPYILLNLEAKALDPKGYRTLELALARPPYITSGVMPNAIGGPFQWVPETLPFRLYPDNAFHPLPKVEFPPRPFDPQGAYDKITTGIMARYAEFWRSRGDYLSKQNDCAAAQAAYNKALNLVTDLPEAKEGLQACR